MKQYSKITTIMILTAIMVFSLGVSELSAQRNKLPDLVITKIFTTRDCRLAVQVKNNGPGIVPDKVWTNHNPKSAGVYVSINGRGWGGQSIWKFDPAKKLKRRGGIATCVLSYKVAGPIKVKAVVDKFNQVKERNERNNKRRTKLRCGSGGSAKLPDLIVRNIRLIKNCKIQVTLRNIGQAGVPASYYNLPKAVGVQMYVDGNPGGGIILSGFDSAGKLKSPGGTATWTWFPNAANLNLSSGVHSIKVVVDNNKNLTESNEGNNTLTKRLKCTSGGYLGTTPQPIGRYSITNIRFSPGSPASLNFKDRVQIKFKYTSPKKVYIFARPMSKGKLSPNYGAQGSKLYNTGSGIGDGFFTINKGKVVVDAVRFRMQATPGSKALYEKIVKVKYTFPKGLFIAPGTLVARPPLTIVKAPNRFFVDFKDAYLAYKKSTKSIQVIAESNVLSYGSDWEKCQINSFIFHIRQKVWKGFYWEINTRKKKVYKVTGGKFCTISGSKKALQMSVDLSGDFFYLRFPKAYLVYVPATKTLQCATEQTVLTYGQDWKKCNLSNMIYQLRENFWSSFYWEINTFTKKAYRVKNNTFCTTGGSKTPLKAGVRVVK